MKKNIHPVERAVRVVVGDQRQGPTHLGRDVAQGQSRGPIASQKGQRHGRDVTSPGVVVDYSRHPNDPPVLVGLLDQISTATSE